MFYVKMTDDKKLADWLNELECGLNNTLGRSTEILISSRLYLMFGQRSIDESLDDGIEDQLRKDLYAVPK